MVYKSNSCLLKTHIISYDPYLFCAFFKRYALYLLQKAKKGEGAPRKSCLRASRPIINHHKISNPPGFRISPLPPYIKLWRHITPFMTKMYFTKYFLRINIFGFDWSIQGFLMIAGPHFLTKINSLTPNFLYWAPKSAKK